jgi:hypothetical protein
MRLELHLRQNQPLKPMEARYRRLREGLLANLMFLVIQFLLGMGVNLFVQVPTNHPGSNPSEYFSGVAQSVTWALLHGHPLLILHAALGLLLVLNSIRILFDGISVRTRSAILTGSFGAFGVIAAGFNGGSFLNYHQDFSSMLMSSGFAVAIASYSLGLYFATRTPWTSQPSA